MFDVLSLMAMVVGREARSNPEDFRYNVALGGYAEPFDDDVYDELAVQGG